MTNKKQICNSRIDIPPLARYDYYNFYINGRNVVASSRPDDRLGVAKCEREKGHEGRCKASKLKYKITMEWWK